MTAKPGTDEATSDEARALLKEAQEASQAGDTAEAKFLEEAAKELDPKAADPKL